VVESIWEEIVLEVGEAEETLDNCVHVAGVTEILHAGVARSEDGDEDFTFF